jgi:hypothetical protein
MEDKTAYVGGNQHTEYSTSALSSMHFPAMMALLTRIWWVANVAFGWPVVPWIEETGFLSQLYEISKMYESEG